MRLNRHVFCLWKNAAKPRQHRGVKADVRANIDKGVTRLQKKRQIHKRGDFVAENDIFIRHFGGAPQTDLVPRVDVERRAE